MLIIYLALFTLVKCQLIPSTKSISIVEEGEEKEKDECWVLVGRFSNASSQFTMCATRNAKPIFLCRNCFQDFLRVRSAFRAIESNHMAGRNCKNLLNGHDRLQILIQTWESIGGKEGLWNKGYCNACYTKPLNKHSKLRNETAHFLKLVVDLDVCFRMYPNPGSKDFPAEACLFCREQYVVLNKYYRENIPHYPHIEGVCIDSLDTLNRTQKIWGPVRFFCDQRTPKVDILVIVSTVIMLLSTIVFYVTAGFFGKTAQIRTVTSSRWLDVVIDVAENNRRLPRRRKDTDGWNDHEHGWETESAPRSRSRRKSSNIVNEAIARAEAVEELRKTATDLVDFAGEEIKVYSESHLEVDECEPEAIGSFGSSVMVLSGGLAEAAYMQDADVPTQIQADVQIETSLATIEANVVLSKPLEPLETETEKDFEGSPESETKSQAEEIDSDPEEENIDRDDESPPTAVVAQARGAPTRTRTRKQSVYSFER